MAARRRAGLAAGGVERHRVPRSDVERVIASSWVTGLSTEIPEIAGGRSGGVHVFVVPDRRPGPSLEPAPATIIGGQEGPVLAVLVLGVAEGQDQRRPVRLDHPGGGDVAAAAAGRVAMSPAATSVSPAACPTPMVASSDPAASRVVSARRSFVVMARPPIPIGITDVPSIDDQSGKHAAISRTSV
jgi:hypothetical protein